MPFINLLIIKLLIYACGYQVFGYDTPGFGTVTLPLTYGETGEVRNQDYEH